MLRAFKTHIVRPQTELSDQTWEFTPLEGEHIGKKYQLMVPGCWENHIDFANYRGKGVYTKTIETTDKDKVRLVFKGASHTANVYLDDKFIKTHYNAYTPFDVVVKDLTAGKHVLKVEVDNSFNEESALHIPNDYMTYGGLNRGVALESLNDLYIKRTHFSPYTKDGKWCANVSVLVENLTNANITADLCIVLDEKTYTYKSMQIKAGETVDFCEDFEFADVLGWDMESPNLYLLQAKVAVNGEVIDDLIERVGFREIKLDGRYILVNDKKIRIKGFNRHEDHPHFGCALPYASMVYDIHQMIDMGANSVRTCHYPNDELFLDLCDEFGLLVWEEHHARGLDLEMMKHKNFDKQCADCIDEMIYEHYNHPSIYIWGILNECASDTEYGANCYKTQLEQIQRLDKTRPNTFASNRHYKDLSFEYPTVISNNMYPMWYFDVPVAEMLQKHIDYANKVLGKDKPFMVSEIGCGGIYGTHNRTREKWTEEGQADTIRAQITPILAHPDCIGVYIWQFCDVRVSTEWAMKRPRTLNNKGMVDEHRREKLAYYEVKEIFNSYSNYHE